MNKFTFRRTSNSFADIDKHADEQAEIEQEEARGSRRRRIDDFLMRTRADQNERDKRERESQRRALEQQEREWEKTMGLIRGNARQEFDR